MSGYDSKGAARVDDRPAKAWGGRFSEGSNPLAEVFTASIGVDRRLYRCDIEGSVAHCRMLVHCGLMAEVEGERIIPALGEIRREIESGDFPFRVEDEDIHMAVERRLIEKVGEIGGKLHAGRSRNDQVALDLRLFLREEIGIILQGLRGLQRALLGQARDHVETILPGYTHLQRAQPVRLAHHLLAYCDMVERDRERLRDCLRRVNVMPLGAGALAGSGLPIDRRYVADLLNFPAISSNSLDSVSDRDVVLEFMGAAAILFVHLSRLCEELVLWSSAEFGFVDLPEAFTTGSSMMPQKKNPDVVELIRGKSGRVFGHLVGLLTVMKGLPLSYNRDLQEDKESLFDVVDTVQASVRVLTALLPEVRFNREVMRQAAAEGFSTATDMADYLVRKGIPFRQAHAVVGRIVKHCLGCNRGLSELPLSELRTFSDQFAEDLYAHLTLEGSIESRVGEGGTARRQVEKQMEEWESRFMEET